jgi:hypothetical protein
MWVDAYTLDAMGQGVLYALPLLACSLASRTPLSSPFPVLREMHELQHDLLKHFTAGALATVVHAVTYQCFALGSDCGEDGSLTKDCMQHCSDPPSKLQRFWHQHSCCACQCAAAVDMTLVQRGIWLVFVLLPSLLLLLPTSKAVLVWAGAFVQQALLQTWSSKLSLGHISLGPLGQVLPPVLSGCLAGEPLQTGSSRCVAAGVCRMYVLCCTRWEKAAAMFAWVCRDRVLVVAYGACRRQHSTAGDCGAALLCRHTLIHL